MKTLRSTLSGVLVTAALALLLSPVPARGVTDAVGREVHPPEKPGRIVSLAPNITEILFSLGAGERVVGVTDFCDYPPEALSRARVGGFVNPSLEVIVSLNPDLIIGTADGNRPGDIMRMEKIGMTVFVIDTRTIGDIHGSIKVIGALTGQEEEAAELVLEMTRRGEKLRKLLDGRERPAVLFLVGRKPLVAAGPGTFIHHLIEAAGGVNALDGTKIRYPLLGREAILSLDPEVIIETAMESGGKGDISSILPGWEDLRAVRAGRAHRLEDDTMLRPGPRIVEALDKLAVLFHPGLMPGTEDPVVEP